MTDRLSPEMLARLDQIHASHNERLDAALTVPGIRDALAGQGSAIFCADTTNTLMDAVENGDSDAEDLAAMFAVAIARLLKLTGDDHA